MLPTIVNLPPQYAMIQILALKKSPCVAMLICQQHQQKHVYTARSHLQGDPKSNLHQAPQSSTDWFSIFHRQQI